MSWTDKVYGEFDKADPHISQVVGDDSALRAAIRALVIAVRKLALADGQWVNEYLNAAWPDYHFACQEEGNNFERLQAALRDVEEELGDGVGEVSATTPSPSAPDAEPVEHLAAPTPAPELEPKPLPARMKKSATKTTEPSVEVIEAEPPVVKQAPPKPAAKQAVAKKVPAKPVAKKVPAKPVAKKVPAKPVAKKVPAKPVAKKMPAKPVAKKVPAKPVAKKVPAKPVAKKAAAKPAEKKAIAPIAKKPGPKTAPAKPSPKKAISKPIAKKAPVKKAPVKKAPVKKAPAKKAQRQPTAINTLSDSAKRPAAKKSKSATSTQKKLKKSGRR